MRLFAALDMPENVAEELRAWWTGACIHLDAADWRDVPSVNWHLTLAFYGDVEGGEADDLAESLAECAAQTAALSLKLTQFGAFPRLTRPRVLWVGVEDAAAGGGMNALARCCRRAGRATVRKRSAKEQPFHGHITVARGRDFPAPIEAEALSEMPAVPEMSWEASSLRLYRSTLHSEGARYRVLEEFELSG
ncbi:MAG: RNA 2',3'-cyclic phosphodiesterase [Mariprofundaceae bacterium]